MSGSNSHSLLGWQVTPHLWTANLYAKILWCLCGFQILTLRNLVALTSPGVAYMRREKKSSHLPSDAYKHHKSLNLSSSQGDTDEDTTEVIMRPCAIFSIVCWLPLRCHYRGTTRSDRLAVVTCPPSSNILYFSMGLLRAGKIKLRLMRMSLHRKCNAHTEPPFKSAGLLNLRNLF